MDSSYPPNSKEIYEELKKAKDDLFILQSKLNSLEKMVEEAKAEEATGTEAPAAEQATDTEAAPTDQAPAEAPSPPVRLLSA